MNAQDLRFYAVVTAGVVLVSAYAIGRGRRPQVTSPPPVASAHLPEADWCKAPYRAIPGGCLALPSRANAELLVYLHGMYADTAAVEEEERRARVARIANGRGMTVLALRGQRGECTQAAAKTSFCWPSNPDNVADAPVFAAGVAGAIAEAEKLIGPATRRLLLGFSNGGYFAAILATRSLVPFDAIAIAGAGAPPPYTTPEKRPPILLLGADEDPSVESLLELDRALTRAGWAHVLVGREGGHALADSDVTHAVTFFERTRKEALPLSPPLSTRAPKPKPPAPEGGDALADANNRSDAGAGASPTHLGGEGAASGSGRGTTPPASAAPPSADED